MTIAELEVFLWGVRYLHAMLEGPNALEEHLRTWHPLSTGPFKLLELSGLVMWTARSFMRTTLMEIPVLV